MPEHKINLPPGRSPPEILRDIAEKFERGEVRSVYLCAVTREGKTGCMMHAAGPPHYATDLQAIGNQAVELCERIDVSLNPSIPGRAS